MLYPPILNGVLPAQTDQTHLKIPFTMSRAVGQNQFNGFSIQIKTLSDSLLIEQESSNYDINKMEAEFNIPIPDEYENQKTKLIPGESYKIQLAYIDIDEEIGYYSSIGVMKFTSKPLLSISDYSMSNINMASTEYVGKYDYTQSQDKTELVYQYQFIIYDSNNEIYEDSGILLHNSSYDYDKDIQYDHYKAKKILEADKKYYIVYKVYTINNLNLTSFKYTIMNLSLVEKQYDIIFKDIELDYENAYFNIGFNCLEKTITGKFLLSKISSKDDYTIQEPIKYFTLRGEPIDDIEFKDFVIEQGITYKYILQQYNDYSIYTEKIYSNECKADFENIFLFDGERQLRIGYNAKINSFKNVVLEQKQEAIGAKYPYIFRNGQVSYKNFPVGGLISYITDTECFFGDEHNNYDTNLSSNNFTKEREHKLEVLQWLTNGKPKLFKSAAEGNYLVRLLDVSMTPEEKLGRMIHNFSSTAYEIGEINYDNLLKYEIYNENLYITQHQPKEEMECILLHKLTNNEYIFNNKYVTNIRFENVYSLSGPMASVNIYKSDNNSPETYYIGATGFYQIEINDNLYKMTINNSNIIGQFIYNYYKEEEKTFEHYKSIKLENIVGRQWFGEQDNIINQMTFNDNNLQEVTLQNIEYIRFIKRPLLKVFKISDNEYYITSDNEPYSINTQKSIKLDKLDEVNYIYDIFIKTDDDIWVHANYYDAANKSYSETYEAKISFSTSTLDGIHDLDITDTRKATVTYIDYDKEGQLNILLDSDDDYFYGEIDLEKRLSRSIYNFGIPNYLSASNGIMIEAVYQIKIITNDGISLKSNFSNNKQPTKIKEYKKYVEPQRENISKYKRILFTSIHNHENRNSGESERRAHQKEETILVYVDENYNILLSNNNILIGNDGEPQEKAHIFADENSKILIDNNKILIQREG